jgi:hypothetical protein
MSKRVKPNTYVAAIRKEFLVHQQVLNLDEQVCSFYFDLFFSRISRTTVF